jgi:multiple sugar transport system permease protein
MVGTAHPTEAQHSREGRGGFGNPPYEEKDGVFALQLMNKLSRKEFCWAMVFLTPSVLGFLAFVVFPVIFALVMAFTNWDLSRREPLAFVGLENFKSLLWGDESRQFWKSALNTLYLAMGMPVSIAGSLGLAVMLSGQTGIAGEVRSRRKVMMAACGLGLAGVVTLLMRGWVDAAVVAGLFFAICAVGVRLGSVFFRTLFYLPYFTSGVALFILWKHLYNPDFGPINTGLRLLIEQIQAIVPGTWGLSNVEVPKWLSSVNNLWGMNPETTAFSKEYFGIGARDAILIMGVWCTIGGNNMLLFLAGLGNVPRTLYESAAIDGAGRWATFREVTWPHLAPTTFFILIVSTMACFQGGFEQARVMTQGGPAGTTITLGYQLYTVGFEEFRLGMASAISWIIFLITFVFTIAGWRFGNRYLNDEML